MIMSESSLGAEACAIRMNISSDYKFASHAADLRTCNSNDVLVLSGQWTARQDYDMVIAMAKRKAMRIIFAS
jgi:ADP-glucose pyrophosphorylase